MNIDQVGNDYSGEEFAKTDYQKLEQGDKVEEGSWVAVTPEGIYEVPGNMSEGYLAGEIDVETENVYLKNVSEGSRVSATSNRVAERHLQEFSGLVESPADILGGKGVQEKDQSTNAVKNRPGDGEIDRIE